MPPIEPLTPADLRRALEIVLAAPGAGRPAPRHQVSNFLRYLAQSPVEWTGWRAGPPGAATALCFTLLLPGRTAIVMLPPPGELGIVPADQTDLSRFGLETLRARSLHYVQALLEPGSVGQRRLLEQTGFRPLAPLIYLERDALFPWVEPAGAGQWLSYDERTHAEFAQVILTTYQDSLDCPELTGLRPIEDVLAAHRACGRFNPAWWQIIRMTNEPAGVLLMTELTGGPMLEIVYMGVQPTFRRRGVGALLLRRALELCRAAQARQLTVVVDERNSPAQRLYARFGLAPVARRDAWLYQWPHTD